MSEPFLVTTDVAATFVVKCRNLHVTPETLRSARERVYYLAKRGILTRHGGDKRGQALWDLHELSAPYRHITVVVLP